MTHREAIETLPWFVNATLPEAERAAVEAHLTVCPECRREVSELRSIQSSEVELSDEIPVPYPHLPEPPRRFAWWISTPLWARAALAAQFVLCAVLWYRTAAPSLGTLSGAAPPGVRIAVQFQPTATEAAIRQILLESGGTIVRGPSAQGLYTISFPKSESEAEALLDQLRHAPFIQFAQRSR